MTSNILEIALLVFAALCLVGAGVAIVRGSQDYAGLIILAAIVVAVVAASQWIATT